MKTSFILVFALTTALYSYSQVVESQPVPLQQVTSKTDVQNGNNSREEVIMENRPAPIGQVQTPLPASDVQGGNNSREGEVIIENKPVRIGEAAVKITGTEKNKKKENEPVKNLPVRKDDTIQAAPKK